jgi:hypothetical protein
MMDTHEDDKYIIYKYELKPNIFETQRFDVFDYKVMRPLKIVLQNDVPVLYLLLREYDYSKNRYEVKFTWTGNPFGYRCQLKDDEFISVWEREQLEDPDYSYIDTFVYDTLVWHAFGREV